MFYANFDIIELTFNLKENISSEMIEDGSSEVRILAHGAASQHI